MNITITTFIFTTLSSILGILFSSKTNKRSKRNIKFLFSQPPILTIRTIRKMSNMIIVGYITHK